MPEQVETVVRVDGRRIHRFQVVRERPEAGVDLGGERGGEAWIVVGFGDDGEEVHLADVDFESTCSVRTDAFRSGRFEPLSAGGVPVWGY